MMGLIYILIRFNFENFFKNSNLVNTKNHYEKLFYYPHLNDSPASSPGIEDIFQILKNKKKMQSILLSEDFQHYCFNNISEISIHKGAQQDSYIAFIKKG